MVCRYGQSGLGHLPHYGEWSHQDPGEVADMLQRMRGLPGHRFWPDDITLLDERYFYRDRLLASAHLTDSYLLALASAHNGKLATFDRRLVTNAVVGGHKALHVIFQGLQ
jgi:predicted nucleic acid-binding protein